MQAVMVRLSARLLKKALTFTDERAKVERELLDGMDVVKCSAWEVGAAVAQGWFAGRWACASHCSSIHHRALSHSCPQPAHLCLPSLLCDCSTVVHLSSPLMPCRLFPVCPSLSL